VDVVIAPHAAGSTMNDHGTTSGQMTSEAFRALSIDDKLDWLAEHGEPADPRSGTDTRSLIRRFPHLADVVLSDVTIPGPAGRTLAARAYVDPTAEPSGAGLVWAHGGAFLGGHLDMPEANWVSLELAASGVPVLSIDYTKCLRGVHYPVPSDDVMSAWEYAVREAETLLGGDAHSLYLGGASAGATLAASAVRRGSARPGMEPAGLVLVYPALHPNSFQPTQSLETVDDRTLEISINYAGSRAALKNPDAFPGLGDGTGFPDTMIVACEFDAMRPSAEQFHATLLEAGVNSHYRLELDSDHGHIDEPTHPGAVRTIAAIKDWIAGHPRLTTLGPTAA